MRAVKRLREGERKNKRREGGEGLAARSKPHWREREREREKERDERRVRLLCRF